MPDNKYVFDFSSSHLGGGRKRLFEYSKYFNEHGGAFFIINSKSKDLIALFPQNSYLAVNKNKFQQLTSNTKYLDNFFKKNSDLDLFYSYGIPIFKKYAKGYILALFIPLFTIQPRVPYPIASTPSKYFCQ